MNVVVVTNGIEGWVEYLLLTLGVVYLLTEAAILAPYRMAVRGWHPLVAVLVYCRSCTGFWVGVAATQWFPLHASHANVLPRQVLSGLCVMLLGYAWSRMWPSNAYMSEAYGGVYEVPPPEAGEPPEGDEDKDEPSAKEDV